MVKMHSQSLNQAFVTLGCMDNTVLIPLERLNVQQNTNATALRWKKISDALSPKVFSKQSTHRPLKLLHNAKVAETQPDMFGMLLFFNSHVVVCKIFSPLILQVLFQQAWSWWSSCNSLLQFCHVAQQHSLYSIQYPVRA